MHDGLLEQGKRASVLQSANGKLDTPAPCRTVQCEMTIKISAQYAFTIQGTLCSFQGLAQLLAVLSLRSWILCARSFFGVNRSALLLDFALINHDPKAAESIIVTLTAQMRKHDCPISVRVAFNSRARHDVL
eukprot:5395436-Pleurochrysis_carterae.AAC.3